MGRIGMLVGIGVFAVACGDDATVASTESENGTDPTSTGTTESVDDDVGTTNGVDPTEAGASTPSADATSDEGTDATGTPIGCGDGVIDQAELYDDGNVEDGDGCGADCS